MAKVQTTSQIKDESIVRLLFDDGGVDNFCFLKVLLDDLSSYWRHIFHSVANVRCSEEPLKRRGAVVDDLQV